MMCIGVTKVCGYGVQMSHVRHFIDPDKVLRCTPFTQEGAPGEDWMERYRRAARERKLQMLEDDCLPDQGGLAEMIASCVKEGDVAGLGDTIENSILLHLPQYPWSQSLIDVSESCEAIYHALAPFLLAGVDGEAIRELIDYIDDAEAFGGLYE